MGYLKTKVTHKKFNYQKDFVSFTIMKILKGLLRSGKFIKFYKIFIRSASNIIMKLKSKYKTNLTFFDFIIRIINFLSPFCDVRNLKASGRTVMVPQPFRAQKKTQIAISFLIQGFRLRTKKGSLTLNKAIKEELSDLFFQTTNSEAYQKKQEFIRNIFFNEKNLRFLKNI